MVMAGYSLPVKLNISDRARRPNNSLAYIAYDLI